MKDPKNFGPVTKMQCRPITMWMAMPTAPLHLGRDLKGATRIGEVYRYNIEIWRCIRWHCLWYSKKLWHLVSLPLTYSCLILHRRKGCTNGMKCCKMTPVLCSRGVRWINTFFSLSHSFPVFVHVIHIIKLKTGNKWSSNIKFLHPKWPKDRPFHWQPRHILSMNTN